MAAQTRIGELEQEKAALESKYARCNPLSEALAAKQKAETAARIAHENLTALQQASKYTRILEAFRFFVYPFIQLSIYLPFILLFFVF